MVEATATATEAVELGFTDVYSVSEDILRSTETGLKTLVDEEQPPEPDYGSMIPVARDKHTGEIIYLPLSDTTRIGCFAKSGEGKTVLGKSFVSRCVKNRHPVFCGSDVKNDFQSFDRKGGVSKQLREATEGLLRGERPQGLPRVLGIPRFMRKFYNSDPYSYSTVFALDWGDVSSEDFKFLAGIDGWDSTKQKSIVNNILNTNSMEELSWNTLFDQLREMDSGTYIMDKLQGLKTSGVISSQGNGLTDFFNTDKALLYSLGLYGIDDSMYGGNREEKFYSTVCHRSFIRMCTEGVWQKEGVLYNHEFHELVPSGEASPLKPFFQKVLSKKGRQAGVSTWIESQEPNKIPNPVDGSDFDFLSSLTHGFVGRGLSWEGYKAIFRSFSFYNQHNTQPLKNRVDQLGENEFLFIDRGMDSVADIRVVRSLAPLVSHPG